MFQSEGDTQDPIEGSKELLDQEIPSGVDRRDFLIRSAVVGAAAIMTGRTASASERIAKAVSSIPQQSPAPPLDPNLFADSQVCLREGGLANSE